MYNSEMTIAEYLIRCMNSGYLRMDRKCFVRGMGETWEFVPNRKYGPGILINTITHNILSVAELSDRVIDKDYNDWTVLQ